MIESQAKKCLKCKVIKSIDNFEKHRRECKACKALYALNHYYENKDKILQKQKDKYHKGYKQYFQEYNEKNKDKRREQIKEYREKNKEKKLDADRLYRVKNKDKILKSRKEKFKIYNSDETFRLKQLISGSVFKALRKNNSSKNGFSSIKSLPYTVEELKKHIESKFEHWMNWDNWGTYRVDTWDDNDSSTWTWHIDHIIPHSSFKYISLDDEEFLKCWALDNLRPYSSKQNIIDGNKRSNYIDI